MNHFRRFLSRFARHDSGISTVEFALLAPTFALLICVSLDFGITMLTQSTLDNAARDASRLIMTGQIQNAGGSAAPFSAKLCSELGTLIPCTGIQYNVQSATTFAALNGTVTPNAGGNMSTQGFSPGVSGSDVLVQVGYNRSTLIPWVGQFYHTGGKILIVSTVAFQNDPY